MPTEPPRRKSGAPPSTPAARESPTGLSRLVEGELYIGGALGARLFRLLAAIDRIGSINRAAQEAGLSYKGAWDMIDRVSNLSPRPLLEKSTGGRDGGGTRLTETGRTLLTVFERIQGKHQVFLDQLNEELARDPVTLQWFRRLFMKASARNQWHGEVVSVTRGVVGAEVGVRLKGGAILVAGITLESVDKLELAAGKPVLALVKAPLVMLVSDMEGYRLSARNQLPGQVSRIREGLLSTEVVLTMAGGDEIVASVTADSIESLGLAVGDQAIAVFKAGAVILGVAAG